MSEDVIVRDVCACGKRYRVRNPYDGFAFTCPNCDRTITIADPKLPAQPPSSGNDGDLYVLQPEMGATEAQLMWARPLQRAELRLARRGSTIGLTGRVDYSSADAKAFGAVRSEAFRPAESPDDPEAAAKWMFGAGRPRRARAFVEDVLASLHFAGERNNLLIYGGFIVAFFLLDLIVMLLPAGFLLLGIGVMAAVAHLVLGIALLHFLWLTLGETARGEDSVPLAPSDWSVWDDAIYPFLVIALITLACAAPAMIGEAILLPVPGRDVAIGVLVVAGFAIWPVAVLAYGMNEQIAALRPDWLLRAVVGVGPMYLLVWMIAAVGALAWWYSVTATEAIVSAVLSLTGGGAPAGMSPFAQSLVTSLFSAFAMAVNVYGMFVLFRCLGLMQRHFGHRMPWSA